MAAWKRNRMVLFFEVAFLSRWFFSGPGQVSVGRYMAINQSYRVFMGLQPAKKVVDSALPFDAVLRRGRILLSDRV